MNKSNGDAGGMLPAEVRERLQVDSAQYRRSVSISINLAAIRHNLAVARQLSGRSQIFATIKADAYGHGAVAVAHALSSGSEHGKHSSHLPESLEGSADGFAIVTLDEALELRQSGIEKPILVLQGPKSAQALTEMRRHELWPVIHDMQQYSWLRQYSDRADLNPWLKVDSGMGRLGVQDVEASKILGENHGIQWKGLMTHFACADEPDNSFTAQQISRFNTVRAKAGIVRSMANSAGVLAWPDSQADWARPGIMLYGCNPLDRQLPSGVSLVPSMTVTASLISVKKLSSGAGVGYAQSWYCPEDMPVGYLGLGYRDGLPRVLDSSAAVYIKGVRCPIVGRVSMDSIAVDLRGIPTGLPGDDAEIWGKTAPIDLLAKAAGTINYELLTSIRGRREYFAAP